MFKEKNILLTKEDIKCVVLSFGCTHLYKGCKNSPLLEGYMLSGWFSWEVVTGYQVEFDL